MRARWPVLAFLVLLGLGVAVRAGWRSAGPRRPEDPGAVRPVASESRREPAPLDALALGRLFERARAWAAAQSCYAAALDDPAAAGGGGEAVLGRARVLGRLGRLEEALAALDAAQPPVADPAARERFAAARLALLLEAGRWEEARAAAATLSSLAPRRTATLAPLRSGLETLARARTLLEDRFERLEEARAWWVTDPLRVRWATRGGLVLRAGRLDPADSYAPPYEPFACVRPFGLGPGPLSCRLRVRATDLRLGAALRLGCFGARAVARSGGAGGRAQLAVQIEAREHGAGLRFGLVASAGNDAVHTRWSDWGALEFDLPYTFELLWASWPRWEAGADGGAPAEGFRVTLRCWPAGAPERAVQLQLALPSPPPEGGWLLGAACPVERVDAGGGSVVLEWIAARGQPRLGAFDPGIEAWRTGCWRAHALAAAGDREAALAALASVVRDRPLYDAAVFSLAWLQRAAGRLETAARGFASLAWSVPRAREELLRTVATLRSAGAWEALLRLFEGPGWALREEPRVSALLREARAQLVALADAERGETLRDLERRARLLLLAGEPERAWRIADRAVRAALEPGVGALVVRGEAARRLGRLVPAQLDAQRARATDPARHEPYLLLARVWLDVARRRGETGETERAQQAARRAATIAKLAVQRAGPSIEPWRVWAQAALAAGEPAQALEAAQGAVARAPRSFRARQLLVRALLASGAEQPAREELAVARRLGPVDRELVARLER
ncbi:MAG: tetratricopeptide repeat protein [Planctomycetota bacterium]|nr:MAG: tetratricopeptide repeat protein [Planctomycetota bacterium]